MFERFTDIARRVQVLAMQEARMLMHGELGSEHLLLALFDGGEGVAAKSLKSLGITHDDVLLAVEEIHPVGTAPRSGYLPYTARGKQAVELALLESQMMRVIYVGTE